MDLELLFEGFGACQVRGLELPGPALHVQAPGGVMRPLDLAENP